MTTFLPHEALALIVASSCLVLTLFISFALGVRYQIAFHRLPVAARNSELDALIGSKEARIQEIDEQLERIRGVLAERDEAEAEAEHWRTMVETAKAEYAALGHQLREIEEVREQCRRALEEVTLAETTLRELKDNVHRAREDAREATERTQEAGRRRDEVEAEAEALRASLADLERSVVEAEGRLRTLKEDKDSVSADLKHGREELGVLKAKRDDLDREVERLTSAKAVAEGELADLRREIEALPVRRDEIERIRGALDDLSRKREALERTIDDGERRENRLEARIARLQEELDAAAATSSQSAEEDMIADLRRTPACLIGDDGPLLPSSLGTLDEQDALGRVLSYMTHLGLDFGRRTINAFHTSLKCSAISPLTVLAGISGTGKSQLPRRYAEAIGIHFQMISVQPRWDSPQDLFGFFNYLEGKYKATEFARTLVHLDRFNWKDISGPFGDRMVLIMLDEMNLARIEYYFSEFLSRLESRPQPAQVENAELRRTCEIEIDVRRQGQASFRVFPGHNVLFTGTINEDESTQALSDKVLDRSNLLRFPRPETLSSGEAVGNAGPEQCYLPEPTWRSWCKAIADLKPASRDRAVEIIARLNAELESLGRPFGHRLNQAVLTYLSNYPGADARECADMALADQVEMRILPKLRGVEIGSDSRPAFGRLASLVRQDLQDVELSEAITKATSGHDEGRLFYWPGLRRKAQL